MTERRERDRPWLIRTYAGYASPIATNARFRANLAKGQTGLSVAFDLPTQTGYDSDHVMSRGEVGKVGVPISHLGDMETVFDQIPLAEMNTSMTINATAVWLLALYVATADAQGAPRAALAGTTQNDILKEYLSRGTHVFPPEASIKLTSDLIIWTLHETPKWNPINVCSYHLQEAGADPVLEVSYALANAIAYLDAVKKTGAVSDDDLPRLVGRISFFANAGIRYIEEMCKMRAFKQLWDRVTLERYGVQDPKYRRHRYGVQVNSLGLTSVQPENNVYRILLEMLAVTQSKDARARAVQLPAWNEALGLPRAWDQQWSLRAQQILAFETDLLEYGDIFEGSKVIETKTEEIAGGAWDELQRVLDAGGAVEALGYMKEKLVTAHAERRRAIESGEQVVVGLNRFESSEPSPLVTEAADIAFEKIDPGAEAEQIQRLDEWRRTRDKDAAAKALDELRRAAAAGDNMMPPSIAAAHAGVTTGEWADALRETYGEYRAPTGIGAVTTGADAPVLREARAKVEAAAQRRGVPKLRLLLAKPGLDGHSNAAEQIAVRARDAGFEVIYQGIRLTPQQIANAAIEEDVHLIGLSILSGAHNLLVPDVIDRLRAEGVGPADVPIVVGGIIPPEDADKLKELGVASVYTPDDFDVTLMIGEMADLVAPA
ncbi:MAG: protein meaA [Actinomycetota bacterium]